MHTKYRQPTEIKIEQGTPLWLALRQGRLTASNYGAAAKLAPPCRAEPT